MQSLVIALPHLGRLSLADNPWSCQCDFVRKFVVLFASSETRDLVVDLAQARCYSADEEAYIDLEANVTWDVIFSHFCYFCQGFLGKCELRIEMYYHRVLQQQADFGWVD